MKKWSNYGRTDGPKDARHYATVGGYGVGKTLGDLNLAAFVPDPWGDGVLVVFGVLEEAPGRYYEGTDFYAVLDYDEAKELWNALYTGDLQGSEIGQAIGTPMWEGSTLPIGPAISPWPVPVP